MTVLVSGCGPIGCLVIAAARLAGAAEIVATDIATEALAIAARLGATRCVDVSGGAAQLADLAIGKGRVDAAIECSGNPSALATAIELVRPRGTIVLVGLGGEQPLPMNSIVAKELRLNGSFRFDAEFSRAAELISDGRVDLRPLLTGTFAIEDAAAAFALASDRRPRHEGAVPVQRVATRSGPLCSAGVHEHAVERSMPANEEPVAGGAAKVRFPTRSGTRTLPISSPCGV